MHPYKSVDPFTASISLRIQNKQRRNNINNVNEIGLPHSLARRRPTSPSLRKVTQSAPDLATLAYVPYYADSSRSAGDTSYPRPDGETIDLEPRGRSVDIYPVHAVPQRRNAMDTTTMGLELPLPAECRESQQDRPRQTLNTSTLGPADTCSTSPALVQDHRGFHQRVPSAVFSDSFLPIQTDVEKTAHLNIYDSPTTAEQASLKLYIITLLTVVIPGQIYLHCLLRLPYMYFSRVDQIFVGAHLTLEEMKDMGLRGSADEHSHGQKMPKAYSRLKKNWEEFIDNLMREWKTLNIISGLLLS